MKKLAILTCTLLMCMVMSGQVFRPGTEIQQNRWYNSSEHNHTLIFQNDGNLVVYNDGDRDPIWNSNTLGRGSRAVFQSDGNLVVYNRSGQAIFSSNTNNMGASYLQLQNDGNLVIYGRNGRALWSSEHGNENASDSSSDSDIKGELVRGFSFPRNQKIYSSNRAYYLIFQRDGNLVFYKNGSTQPLWASNTDGRGVRAEFQSDGNLVVYGRGSSPLFSSNTERRGDNMSIQNDGNVVIYNSVGNPVWSSNR